jgi:UDP-glucose 4-epimerase
VRIFGENGTVRDYLYVTDLAAGIVAALERGKQSETYNIGSGLGLSNRDVIDSFTPLFHEAGKTIQVETLPERLFDVKANVLDSNRLQRDTGWKPRVGFSEGLQMTFEWIKNSYA